jgi:two-component system response regulator NreC
MMSSPHEHAQGTSQFRKIRCVLVHDHVLLRQGLRRLLQDEPDLEVVAEAGSAAEALLTLFEHHPDVVITEARVFECGADEAKQLLAQASPRSRVLFLAQADVHDGGHSMRQTSAEELIEMVREVHHRGQPSMKLLPGRLQLADEKARPRTRELTAREREVLRLLAEGRTVRSAAETLGLSAKTVEAHKFNLMRKLGIHNKAELVMWAIQERVLKLPVNF